MISASISGSVRITTNRDMNMIVKLLFCEHSSSLHAGYCWFIIASTVIPHPSLLTPHVPRLLSIPHLFIPHIHLSCGALALHTVLVLFITLFPTWNSLISSSSPYISIFPPRPLPCFMHRWFPCSSVIEKRLCFRASSIDTLLLWQHWCKWVGRRITDALIVADVLRFDRECGLTCGVVCEKR